MKILRSLLIAAALTASFSVSAQYFNHLSVGPTIGTDGIGVELATPIGDFVQLRAGYSFMPKFSIKTDVDINAKSVKEVKVEGKLNMGDGKVLFDVFPIKGHGFHITAGAYIGRSELITVENAVKPIPGLDPEEYGKTGILIGDYVVTTDANGNAKAAIKVNSFKPYLGVGFGRGGIGRDTKNLVSVQCNLGVEFWGSPGVYAWDPNQEAYVKVTEKDIEEHTATNILKTISKIGVYPVINMRVAFRAF